MNTSQQTRGLTKGCACGKDCVDASLQKSSSTFPRPQQLAPYYSHWKRLGPKRSSIGVFSSINRPEDSRNFNPRQLRMISSQPLHPWVTITRQWQCSHHRCSKQQWWSRCPGHSWSRRPLVEKTIVSHDRREILSHH